MLNSTFNVAGSIISGVVNGAIALVFALYILAQKERLASQGKGLSPRICRRGSETDCWRFAACYIRTSATLSRDNALRR